MVHHFAALAAQASSGASGAAGFGQKLVETLGQILREQSAFVQTVVESEAPGELAALLAAATALLAGFYGFFMGAASGPRQALSSAVKTPALFLLPLAISLPFLHVVNALAGAQLELFQTAALMLFAVALHCLILASFAPIAGFFAFSGSDYHFARLTHIGAFAFCGGWAIWVLLKGVADLREARPELLASGTFNIFQVWIAVYGLAGAQMAWTLRPFIGAPGQPFAFFRGRAPGPDGFFAALWESLREALPSRNLRRQPEVPELPGSSPTEKLALPPSEREKLPEDAPPGIRITEAQFKEALTAALRRQPPSPKREAAMAQAAWEALAAKKSSGAKRQAGQAPGGEPEKRGASGDRND